jgi:hypothetical protein
LRSQIATSNTLQPQGRGGRRYLPYAFTEHGAIMAATILNSSRAVEMSVYVVRAFVKLRDLHLGVSIEELIGDPPSAATKKRGPTPKIQQQMERIQRLPKAQQRFVMQMIDTVVARQGR